MVLSASYWLDEGRSKYELAVNYKEQAGLSGLENPAYVNREMYFISLE